MIKDKKLSLFFTEGVTLDLWFKKGLLDREKLLYEKFLEFKIFDKIFWFTYGSEDKIYEKYLKEGIIIIPKPKIFVGRLGSFIYSFILPFIQRRYLRECSVLKTNQMWGSWSAVFSKILYKKPLLIRTGYTVSKFAKNENKKFWYLIYKLVERVSYKFADYSTVSSEYDIEYIVRNYNTKNVKVVYNFIDIHLFKPLNVPKSKDITFVGRLSKQKNLFNLIKALKGLNYSLDIYGSGELKAKLEKLAKDLNTKVYLKGNVPNSELPKILNQYKLYILCSFYEGLPKTLLEAMSCGLACLGTNVVGINEVIQHNVNGWLVGIDEKNIRTGILKLLENRKLRERLRENARKTIKQKFNLEQIVNKEIQIYEKIN